MKPTEPAAGGTLKIRGGVNENPIPRITEELLTADLKRFDDALLHALKPQEEYLTDTEYELYKRGKKLRPIMLVLSARLLFGDGELPQKVIEAAVSLEMLHVATLIHDDIIDDALLRRGLKSVNAQRGVNTAILVGDMQFVQAVRCFVDAIDTEEDMGLVRMVLDTAFRICCGELDELNTDPNWETGKLRGKYFETIERKTAVLFGLSCESGAALVDGRTSQARRIGFYGRRVGRAFQIMDDLFDVIHEDKKTGKLQGTDLAQRRVSLPIIYAMEELGPEHLVSRIMKGAEFTDKQLDEGMRAIRNTDGFKRAYADARKEIIDALQYLDPFPANRYRDALEEIALYVVNRNF
ncbi:MAG: polyprenyl synthetase family protein [bacterium]|nr:polyprenyl synthetase family protein [bacterium]